MSQDRRSSLFQWILGGSGVLILTISTIVFNGQDKRLGRAEENIWRNTLYKEEVTDHDKDVAELKTLLKDNNRKITEIYLLLLAQNRKLKVNIP